MDSIKSVNDLLFQSFLIKQSTRLVDLLEIY